MSHGFMQSIIKNQVDRDSYDRQLKDNVEPSKTTSKNKKPTVEHYSIPVLRSFNPENQKCSFVLEFEDLHGFIHKCNIFDDDDPSIFATKFGKKHKLTEPMIKVLADLLDEEIEKRKPSKS